MNISTPHRLTRLVARGRGRPLFPTLDRCRGMLLRRECFPPMGGRLGLYPWVTAIVSPAVSTVQSLAASLMRVGFSAPTSADFRPGDNPTIQRF